ncbi:MAG: HAMP domain-containing protein [Cyanobacteria bacterium SBLK]|nr:HAMP domain-containing protein [Cyanobacteria bacterium SBLK]
MLKFWKKSLLVQIVGSFSLLSLAIVALVGYVAFREARESLKESIFDRLTAIASLKEGELNRWLRDRRNTFVSLSRLPEIGEQARVLLGSKKSTLEYQTALKNLQASLGGFIGDRADYREIFLLSRGNRIVASTHSEKIGRYEPLDQSIEVMGNVHEFFAANFYRASDGDRPAVTLATPIFNAEGKRLGVLAVHLNLDRLDEIIRDDRGLGETGETYLVANLGTNFTHRNAFVSAAGFGSEEFPDGIASEGIEQAMMGKSDRGLYGNYRGIPVIGSYRWLDARDVALLVEMEQAEAFAPARRLAYAILFVGSALSAILAAGILFMSRRIVKPILAIAQTARSLREKVREGQFAELQTAPVLTDNEIGILARTFNQLTEQLQKSYEQLQDYSSTLEEKVTTRTRELKDKNEDLQATLIKLQKTQTQLIQNEKMASLGQMVAGIAHEINNPVNFIYGNLRHLEAYATNLLDLLQLYDKEYPQETPAIAEEKEEIDIEFLQEDLPKVLNSIQIGTQRIREIVVSLRNFSRLDEADRKQADLHEGIESTLLILQNRLKAKSNRPEIQIAKEYGQLPKIECYPGQLNQVFLNLISNAIDALELGAIAGEIEKPTIRIHTMLKEKFAMVCIVDNGPGMSEETRRKIFDPFFTTKEIGKGTGLGLSISYSIAVERHGGELSCISSLGNGAEFIVSIPI